MAMIVQKYGGSSLADVAKLQAVAEAVVHRWRAGDRVVVVVSAMGKTTDMLIAQAREISADPPRRELDMLVSVGERISMALLSMAVQRLGGESISFTGSQCGIITDDSHQNARILEVRPVRIEDELARGRIVIVAGYQGVSRNREITTLGRGGSDTTAVALAAALKADACEIYSDVDGVYSGDPNLCPQARLLPQVGYSLMQAMASAGAKVLNADAVEFAKRAGITIFARKTGDPSGRETQVSQAAERLLSGVAAVVANEAVSSLVGSVASWPEAAEAVAACGGRVLALAMRSDCVALVDRVGIPGRDSALLARIAADFGLVSTDVGVVTLVGGSLLSRPQTLARLDQILVAAGIGQATKLGNDTAMACVVPVNECKRFARVVHDELVESNAVRAD